MSLKTRMRSLKKKNEKPVRKMYQRYQKLWTRFCEKNNVKEEYDDVSLVKLFKQIEPTCKPKTLWVIYSCINARFIDEYGKNLMHLPRLHKHLNQVTQLYVATKLTTFTPEEIHKVLHSLQDSSEKKWLCVELPLHFFTIDFYAVVR